MAAASIFTAWLGLYLAAYLLLAIASLYRVTWEQPQGVILEPLPARLDQSSVVLSGRARPGALLQLGINDRVNEIAFAGPDGTFRIHADLPASAHRVWVHASTTQQEELGRVDAGVHWAPGTFEPRVDLCLISDRLGLVWLAGRSTAYEGLDLLSYPSSLGSEPIQADEYGVIDLLIPFTGEPPHRVALRNESTATSVAAACQRLTSAGTFPLARRITIVSQADLKKLIERSKDSSVSDRSKDATDFLAAMLPLAEFEISLPAQHPYYRTLTEGFLSPTAFLSKTIGEVAGVPHSDSAAQQLRTLEEIGVTPPPGLVPEARVWLEGASGKVQVRVRLVSYSLQGQLRLIPASGSGIAARPLLTQRDQFRIRTAAKDTWSFRIPPQALAPELATWSGPLVFKELTASGPLLLDRMQAFTPADRSTKAPNIRDFFRAIEPVETRHPSIVLWRALLALVPPAAIVWLLRRREAYASLQGASGLLALTLLVALVLDWPAVRSLTGGPLARWSLRVLEQFYDDLRPIRLPSTALWVIFVTLVGAVPFYFSQLAEALAINDRSNRGHEPGGRSAWRVIAKLLRLAYGALVFAILWHVTRPRTPNVFSDPKASQEVLQHLGAVGDFVAQQVPWTLVPLLLLVSLFFCAGVRGVLFVGGFWLGAQLIMKHAIPSDHPAGPWLTSPPAHLLPLAIAGLALVGLSALPLTMRLLRVGFPVPWPRFGRSTLAVALIATCLTLNYLSPKLTLAAAAGLLGLGLLWATAAAYGSFAPARELGRRMKETPGRTALVCFAAGVALGWPIAGPGQEMRISDLANLVQHWGTVLPSMLAIGLALLVFERIASTNRRMLTRDELAAGAIFYAVFLVSPTITWLFLPVPLLVAVALARHWIFQNDADRFELSALEAKPANDSRRLAKTFLGAATLHSRLEAAIKSLNKEIENARILPSEYEDRLRQYQQGGKRRDVTLRQARRAFAFGDTHFTRSVRGFLRMGLLIATGPILISLYEYLPVSKVSYPFPVADFLVFLLAAILKWGLYALFFGLFFANLRGETGLTKGLHLFLAAAAPFAVYHLLRGVSPEELRSFLFWLTQLFVFFGLLGLLAADLRLLKLAGFSASDLRAVHRLPALYTFLSAAAAAILPTILAAVAGRVGDAVKFFMELVLPGMSASP